MGDPLPSSSPASSWLPRLLGGPSLTTDALRELFELGELVGSERSGERANPAKTHGTSGADSALRKLCNPPHPETGEGFSRGLDIRPREAGGWGALPLDPLDGRCERRRLRYELRSRARDLYGLETHDAEWARAPGRHAWRGAETCALCGASKRTAKGRPCDGPQGRRADGRAYRGRFAACGYVARGGSVTVHAEGARAWYAGLATCSSVHACPCCAPAIMVKRGDELRRLAEWHEASGGALGMGSFTIRHRRADDLDKLWDGVANAWRRMARGRPWERFAELVTLAGTARRIETTEGKNGWHTHLHVAFYVSPAGLAHLVGGMRTRLEERPGQKPKRHVLGTRPDSLARWLLARWRRCVVRELGLAYRPSMARGFDFLPLTSDDGVLYLSKLGCELATITDKRTKKGNRTTWGLLDDATRGDSYARKRWAEFVRASKGRRLLTVSPKLRELAGLGPEGDDDATEPESGDPKLRLPAATWQGEPERDELGRAKRDERGRLVWRGRPLRWLPGLICEVLELVERERSTREIATRLRAHGVVFDDIEQAPHPPES